MEEGYILAIVGSRNLKSKELFQEGIVKAIEQWGVPSEVVSGGAKGADTMGEKWARDNEIVCTVYKPDWNQHGKKAGILRNIDIINKANKVLAFPSKKGKGTQHSIGLTIKQQKELIKLWID